MTSRQDLEYSGSRSPGTRLRPLARATRVAASLVASVFLALGMSVNSAAAQSAMQDALGHEDAGRFTEAAGAYRQLLNEALNDPATGTDQIALALLGLERNWHQAAMRDSIVPVVREVLARRPADPVARSIQFRALAATAQDSALRRAFVSWRRAVPEDPKPWREYVRTLMSMGRPLAADSALAEAAVALGGKAALASEVAQIAATLERWDDAARAWRSTLVTQPWMEMAASFSLQAAPDAARDSVRDVLQAEPVELMPRRLLATLETGWGDPRRGWAALASARENDSALVAWREFGERAEAMGAFSVARDVWSSLFSRTADAKAGTRAAQAALASGEPDVALELLARVAKPLSERERAEQLLQFEVEALGALGRAAEATARIDASDRWLDDATRTELARPLVSAWLRAGDVEAAREAAARAGTLDDDQTIGWLALYEGDLAEARRRLVRSTQRDRALTDALAVLARTRTVRHVGLGEAFLALARQDSTEAIGRFAGLADSLPDAAPALLATAARLATRTGVDTLAVRYWTEIVDEHAAAPEVPEALLEVARALTRRDDLAAAIQQYETLLIDHSGSAMVPQARRELEKLRGRIPEFR